MLVPRLQPFPVPLMVPLAKLEADCYVFATRPRLQPFQRARAGRGCPCAVRGYAAQKLWASLFLFICTTHSEWPWYKFYQSAS